MASILTRYSLFVSALTCWFISTAFSQNDSTYSFDMNKRPHHYNAQVSTNSGYSRNNEAGNDLIYAGSTQWSGRNDIELYGDLLYCAMVNGIMIYDVSDPALPVLQAQIYLNENVTCIVISDGLLYLGFASGNMAIFGLNNPLAPNKLAEYNSDFGGVTALTIWNNLAFVGQNSYGIEIVDITQSESPYFLASKPTQGLAPRGFDVIGDTLYVAAGRLWAFDISLPSAPDSLACIDVPEYAWDVQIVDTLAYIAGRSNIQPYMYSRLSIFNISDLTNAQLLSSFRMSCNIYDVEVVDSLAYVAAGESGVAILNIRNAEDIRPIGCFGGTGMTNRTIVIDSIVFANSYRPSFIESMPIGYSDICTDSFIPEIDSFGDLIILDVSNPAIPIEISRIVNPDLATSVSLYNDLAVVCSEIFGGITISRFDNEGHLELISATQVSGSPQTAIMRGNYIYVAALYGGLAIVDVTDIAHPFPIGECDSVGMAVDAALFGNYAIVTNGYGFSIIDVSNPESPQLVNMYSTSGFSLEVEVSGDYMYLSDREGGLKIYDISDIYNPILKSTYPEIGDGRSRTYLALRGDIIALSVANAKVEFLDISNPEQPQFISEYPCTYTMYGLALNENIAVVAYNWYGIDIIDITDIKYPVSVAEHNTPYCVYDVAVNQDYLFVADDYSLLSFLSPSVSDIPNQDDNGMNLPMHAVLYQNHPNPFNSSTLIECYISRRSLVHLGVVNQLGQTVSVLVDCELEPGLYQFPFSPSTNSGELASGIYIYSLKVGKEVLSRQMIFVK